MLVWIVDAGNFGCCLAYCIGFLIFHHLKKESTRMARPYKVKHYKIVGVLAVLMSGFMVAMYIIPGSGSNLVPQEWAMAGGWAVLGIIFFIVCKLKYKEKLDLTSMLPLMKKKQWKKIILSKKHLELSMLPEM